MYDVLILYRSWAKCLAARNLGESEEKSLKIFEIFIPEIVANVSNFKN